VERHYTVLRPDETRDGPVSINPEQLRELVSFARMPQEEVRTYVESHIPEHGVMVGREQRPLSEAELLNRDYYRGRFASRAGNELIYNWEEKPFA
jgi:N,N'-diacetyllegionaminate synthase